MYPIITKKILDGSKAKQIKNIIYHRKKLKKELHGKGFEIEIRDANKKDLFVHVSGRGGFTNFLIPKNKSKYFVSQMKNKGIK